MNKSRKTLKALKQKKKLKKYKTKRPLAGLFYLEIVQKTTMGKGKLGNIIKVKIIRDFK